jgi:PAS domain S-box-containing protein
MLNNARIGNAPLDGRVNILLVDDQPAQLLALRAVLEDLGHNLIEARSGEEALQRVASDEFAVILLDVQMPGLDGFETARLIRDRDDSRHTPIIFLTGYEENRLSLEEAYALGAVDYLVKPFSPVIFRAKVKGFVELFQRTRQIQRQVEQLRREEQVQWRITLASIGDGVIVTDVQGHITSLNPVAENLTGWRKAEAIGRPLEEAFCILHETTRQPVEAPIVRVLQAGVVMGLGNHTILIAKDGTELPIDDSAAPVKDEEGTVRGVVLVFRDVTEKRRLERLQRDLHAQLERQVQERTEELRRSEERFRLLVEGTKDYAIFLLDHKGYIESWNPGAERIKGYQADEIIGQHFSRFYSAEDILAGKPNLELEMAAANGKYEEEDWRLRKDGSRFWASVLITALHDDAGNIRGFSKITRNMTQRMEAEATARRLAAEQAARQAAEANADMIRQQHEELRVTLESIGDAVIAADPEGKVTLLNPVAQRLTGWSTKEAFGQPLGIVFNIKNERTGQQAEDPVARVLREGVVIGLGNHTILTARDGTLRPVEDSAAPITDEQGRVIGVVLVFHDVTQRRWAEQATHFLADASAALAGLVDYKSTLQKVAGLAVPHYADWCAVDLLEESGSLQRLAVAHVDPAKIQLAHEAYRRYPPDLQAPHGPPHVIRTGQAELVPEITDDMILAAGRDEEHLRLLHQLGLRSYLCVPLVVQGRSLGAITFIHAESGRRYGPADLQLAQDLAHRAAIAIENSRLYSELRETDRKKDEFLAMLAHELRNPLAPLRNAVQILRMRGVDAATAERARDMMERQIHNIVRLVDDLLDVSRIMQGKIYLRKEPVEIATIVAGAVETAQPFIDAQGHHLTVSLPQEPVLLEADAVRLAQVVNNLLTNSAKYMKGKGRIWLEVERKGEELVLRVRDTGIGIAPDLLPHVFDLFVQAEHGVGRAQGGLGIGLTLVRRLVELHGGHITAYSEGLGKGSEFTVRVPALPPSRAAAKAVPERWEVSPTPHGTRRRILVVDDNVDAGESLAMLLRLVGQDVQLVHDGPSALEAAQAQRPDLVFLDIGMPVMDGYEAARRLRQQFGPDQMKLVALTGWGQDEDRRRSQAAGFDRHLVKPVDPAVLYKVLDSLDPKR